MQNDELSTCKTSWFGWLLHPTTGVSDFQSINFGGTGSQVSSENKLHTLK
jgi:hypothetical protein